MSPARVGKIEKSINALLTSLIRYLRGKDEATTM